MMYQQEQRALYLQQMEIKQRLAKLNEQKRKEEEIRKSNLRKYL